MTTVEKILKLCNDKGITPSRMMRETGMSKATFSSWKTGRTAPKQGTLMKVAEYFDVPLSDLEEGEEFAADKKEEFLLKIFRDCSEEQKRKIVSAAMEISEA